MNQNEFYLPRTVTKYELTEYFGCSYKYLWSTLLTESLLESWGLDPDEIKALRRFPPKITRRIYLHFEIINLHEDFVETIKAEIKKKQLQAA